MRISGLATGMDTEKIISDLMKAQRLPLDKMTQKKQYMQWQLDDYRKTNRDLRATSDKVFDTVMKQSTFMAKNVTVSNPDAVNIQNKNSTSDFTGSILVKRLATQATLQSSQENVITKDQFENKTLSDLGITSSSITIKAVGSDGVMPTEGIKVDINPSDTVKTVLEKINKQTDVNAYFDTFTGKIAFSSKNSGEGGITIDSDNGKFNEILKIDNTGTIPGKNSLFVFNGLETQRSSNTFDIDGINITLKQVTTSGVTFSSAPDTDKVVDAVTQFVNDYNKMIEDLNAKIREPKYRGFQPLSDEQKKDMKETEIKLWDEKAMSGTLRNDPEISSMLTKLRTLMSSTVEGADGKPISLKDMGITPSTSYTENGKLTINEAKLREAIAENPNKVYELFASPSQSATDVGGAKKGGLAVQFRAVVDENRGVISKKAGSTGSLGDTFTMGRTMKEMNKQIDRFEDRLKMVESRYWKQFNAMENAIQRANAQSASLMSALGGGA